MLVRGERARRYGLMIVEGIRNGLVSMVSMSSLLRRDLEFFLVGKGRGRKKSV